MKTLKCEKCGGFTEHLFNGSQEICGVCLLAYVHSDEEILNEIRKRGYNGEILD